MSQNGCAQTSEYKTRVIRLYQDTFAPPTTLLSSNSYQRVLMADHNSQDPLGQLIRITKILPRILFSSMQFAVLLALYAANHDNDFSFINLLNRSTTVMGVCCCIDISRYVLATGVPILYHSLIMVLKRRWTFGRCMALALRITDGHWRLCKYSMADVWCSTFLTSTTATLSPPRETTPLLPLHADDIV
jgi:hypothetical protein